MKKGPVLENTPEVPKRAFLIIHHRPLHYSLLFNMFSCTFCGAATRSVYYKRQKRQTHHAPCDTPDDSHQMHIKVCTRKTCGKRFSICDRHAKLGWQEWHQEERFGRRECKTVMWVHNCKGCVHLEKTEVSMVLCPECKAPFINKGPKWYSKLAQRCRHGKTRSTNWLKMRQSVRTLVNLGETPEAIFEWIRGLNCMKRCMKRGREETAKKCCPEKCCQKEATVCDAPESPKSVCARPQSPKALKGVATNSLNFQTPRFRKPKTETIIKKHAPPNKRARKGTQEQVLKAKEDIHTKYVENATARAMPELQNNAICADEYLGTFDDLLVYHHTGSNEMFRC